MTFDRNVEKSVHYSHEQQHAHKRHLDNLKYEFKRNLDNPNPKIKSKNITDMDVVQPLGHGAFGVVFLVRDTMTLKYHAMKAIDKEIVIKKRSVKHIHLEKKILQSIDFPFTINLDYAFKDNLYVHLIEPFEAGGDVFALIKRLGSFSEPLALFYAAQIVLALEYIHHCCIIHRDLKPENILIGESGYIKLSDFGLSKIMKSRTWTLCGTPDYLAPEALLSKGYSFAADWWSFGVLIYEMISGFPPFLHSDPMKQYEMILEGRFKTPDCMTVECKSMVKDLLQTDPTKRLGSLKSGVYDIKTHKWFHGTDWPLIFSQKFMPPYKPICSSPGDVSNFPNQKDVMLKRGSKCLFEKAFENF